MVVIIMLSLLGEILLKRLLAFLKFEEYKLIWLVGGIKKELISIEFEDVWRLAFVDEIKVSQGVWLVSA